jgi:Tol biopolymer transport system component
MRAQPTPTRRPAILASLAGLTVLVAACGDQGTLTTPADVEPGRSANPHAEPTVFAPGVISDAREQWRITFTPDGGTAYYSVSDQFFPFSRQATIVTSRLVNGMWTLPQVASFSGVYSDIDPFIAPDGSRLYFSSIRPVDGVTTGDIDLWMVERDGDGWGEPVHLGPSVNSPADELYPSVAADGTLYFASGPPFPMAGAQWDIYRAAPLGGGFAPRERLGSAVNSSPEDYPGSHLQAAWDFNPEISADGKTLVFTSLRPGGYGLGDLYVSHLHRGEWTQARNLGPPVNTAADEYHPTLSPDGKYLYFVRRTYAPWVDGDFYRVRTSALGNRLRPGYTLAP